MDGCCFTGESDPDDDVGAGHGVYHGVLVRGHGVHAALLHGHARLHAGELGADEAREEGAQVGRVRLVPRVGVARGALVQADLDTWRDTCQLHTAHLDQAGVLLLGQPPHVTLPSHAAVVDEGVRQKLLGVEFINT